MDFAKSTRTIDFSEESARLNDLYSYKILDTESETEYSELIELAALICECPIAGITFIDKDRQWFKAKVGDQVKETPLDISFCSHTILEEDALVVTDPTSDIRFRSNPDVTDGLKIRFYAGVPIYSKQNKRLGAVCVIDNMPRSLTSAQLKVLKLISKQITQLLELRLKNNELKRYSQKLLENTEKTIELYFDNSTTPKWIYQIDTLEILQVNDAAIKMYGYSKEEFLKLCDFDLRTPDEKKKIHQLLRDINNDSAVTTFDTVHQTKVGKKIHVEVTIAETVFLGKVARLATILDSTEIKSFEKKLIAERKKNSKKIIDAQVDTEKKTKDKIGQELHDNINQILGCTLLYLGMASNNEEVRVEMIDRCKEFVADSINAIRQLSSSLVSPEEDGFRLADSVSDLTKSISLANTLSIHLSIDNKVENLPKDVKINLFRIIQEQMNNILKYARASEVSISITLADALQLLIKDNGIGFNPAVKHAGIGLTNIKNRAGFYNGIINITSSPSKGCELLVQLPLV